MHRLFARRNESVYENKIQFLYSCRVSFIVFRNHGLWPWVSGYAPAQLLTNCLSPYGGLPKAPCFARGCLLGVVCAAAVVLRFGVLAGSAQTGQYLFTGSETTITLNPGLYAITAYGAQGGSQGGSGGQGAEMEGEFSFSGLTTLTLLVGGGGGLGSIFYGGGGGGGGGYSGGSGLIGTSGGSSINGGLGGTSGSGGGGGGAGAGTGGGGGFLGNGSNGGGYGFGGGGGSIIDSSGTVLAEVSGIASPDGSPNGEILITAIPEPTTLALVGLGGLSLMLFRRQRK
jgi:hypothetical protein